MPDPDKAAISYLTASGAACISVLADGTIKAGPKPDRGAVSLWWVPAAHAIAVSRQARRDAGENPDVAASEATLRQGRLSRIGLGDASQTDLPVRCGQQDNVVRLNAGELVQDSTRRVAEPCALLPHLQTLP
jgi:hypothetical protein